MKKNILKNSLIFLAIAGLSLFASCSNETQETPVYYMVSYSTRYDTAPEPVKVAAGTVLSKDNLPALTYTGATFTGWYIGDTRIQPGAYAVNGNVVLTAHWSGADCQVTYTHSSNISGLTYTKIYENGTVIQLPSTPYGTKTGLQFMGWQSNSVFYLENQSVTITSDTVFTAVYEETGSHTVSYYNVVDGVLLEGTEFSDITTLTGSDNPSTFTESQAVFISDVKKTGYTFGGWYTSRNCLDGEKATTFWNAGTVFANVNLYAKWTMNSYNVTFNGNGGTLIDASDEQSAYNGVKYNETITMPSCKYRYGDGTAFTFTGWTTNTENFTDEYEAGQTLTLSELAPFAEDLNITLYAHWKDTQPPAAPSGFDVRVVASKTVKASWTTTTDTDLAYTRLSYYYIQDGKKSPLQFKDFTNTGYTEYKLDGLTDFVIYYFTITSYDVAGNANNYDASCIKQAVPRSVTKYEPDFTITQLSASQIKVEWASPSETEYPNIQKISLYLNDCEVTDPPALTGSRCFTDNSFTVTVEPETFYDITLKIDESEDALGSTNESAIQKSNYLTEPANTVELVSDTVSLKKWWKYSDELGFNFDTATIPSDSRYSLYAKCYELDKDGNVSSSVLPTTAKLSDEVHSTDPSARNLYIRSNLEPDKSYKVEILLSVTKTNSATNVTKTSYSYTTPLILEKCTTEAVSNSQVDAGYIYYGNGSYYPELQNNSVLPVAIVAVADEYNLPKTLMALKDWSDGTTCLVTSLAEAQNLTESITSGGLIWSVPEKTDIENVFSPANKEKVFGALNAVITKFPEDAGLFTESSIDEDGSITGRYITGTIAEDSRLYAFDIAEDECGNAVPVSTSGSFRLRPFVKF